MTEAVSEPIAQGRLLVELAAVQRGAVDGLLSRVRFAAHEAEVTAAVGDSQITRNFSLDADRREVVAQLFTGEAAVEEAEGFPAVAPPRAVYAEILHDLGAHSDALSGYLDSSLRYSEVSTDGRVEAIVRVRDDQGVETEAQLSLTSGMPPIGLPYTLVEQLRVPQRRPAITGDILQNVVTRTR